MRLSLQELTRLRAERQALYEQVTRPPAEVYASGGNLTFESTFVDIRSDLLAKEEKVLACTLEASLLGAP